MAGSDRKPHGEDQDITRMLSSARAGNAAAVRDVFDRVYAELRRIARGEMRRLAPSATMNTTAVVHEAYLKLVNARDVAWEDRSHFFGVAATAMRQILVDAARRRSAAKRGGRGRAISLDDLDSSEGVAVDPRTDDILSLDAALTRLASLDARLSRVVELRYFAGLSVEETAAMLGVTDRTIRRDWRRARAFLYSELGAA